MILSWTQKEWTPKKESLFDPQTKFLTLDKPKITPEKKVKTNFHNQNYFDMLQFASKIYIDIYLSSRNIVGTPNNELCTEDVGL